MRRLFTIAFVPLLAVAGWAQAFEGCACGKNPPKPANREMKPYAGEPDDLRPWGKFGGAEPYWENYTSLIEYNGAAREVGDGDVSKLDEIRVGFIGPIENHPEEKFGKRMLHGAQMAIDDANAKGGYGGKPFKLMLHNDSAVWGASSNEVIKMAYDEKVWAMFGAISGDTTHIALRVALKVEVPLINSAATDPTIPETLIPWFFNNLQDDRVQSYTLARHIFTELGLKRVAILRVNDRYGRFGVGKFKDASRRLGHMVIIEQKFRPGDTDFRRALRIINDTKADAIVLWTDQEPVAGIMQQMKELGMTQKLFGSHRTIGDELLQKAGPLAEGYQAVFPYDASRDNPRWLKFKADYKAKYGEEPEQFAAQAYDAMTVLLRSICEAGLNRGRIRDAMTAVTSYHGVTADQVFDPNCKNVAPMFLATVKNGKIEYRRATMEKAYAEVGEDGVNYSGPAVRSADPKDLKIAVFGPNADEAAKSPEVAAALAKFNAGAQHVSLVPIVSDANWGKSSTKIIDAIYNDHVIGIIGLDRNSSHLAEQLAVKTFVPVIALSADKSLTSVNIPWIFRMPSGATAEQAVASFMAAIEKGGPNAEKVRAVLASGQEIAGVRFQTTGEPKQ